MRRRFCFILMGAALALLLGFTTGSTRAATDHVSTYHPPVLAFGMWATSSDNLLVGTTSVRTVIAMTYSGGAPYPEIRRLGDKIPLVQVKLYLPSGIHIVSSKFKLALAQGAKVPKSNLRYTLKHGLNGTSVATWNYYGLKMTPVPSWVFGVNRPPDANQHCLVAAEAFPGVKYAPKQTVKACFQGSGSS